MVMAGGLGPGDQFRFDLPHSLRLEKYSHTRHKHTHTREIKNTVGESVDVFI